MPTWNTGNGTWGDSADWTGGVPNGVNTVADFPTFGSSINIVGLDLLNATIGTLNFASSTGGTYILRTFINATNAPTLIMERSSGNAQINVGALSNVQFHKITNSSGVSAGPMTLQLASNTDVTTTGVTSGLELTAKVTGTGLLSKLGSGVLEFGNALNDWTGGLSVGLGTVKMVRANGLAGGNVTVLTDGVLNLNGFSQTIRNLSGSGDVQLNGGDLTITGQTGAMSADFFGSAAAESLSITLNLFTVTFSNAGASFTSWSSDDNVTIIGNGLGNTITGSSSNAAPERIEGRGGNDDIDARSGADTVDGGSGADTIQGGFGKDVLVGGMDDDLIYGEDSLSSLTEDEDTYIATSATDGSDSIRDVEILDYRVLGAANPIFLVSSPGGTTLFIVNISGGDDDFAATGNALSPVTAFLSGAGDDNLSADNLSPVSMLVDGGFGNDTIRNGSTGDTLDGGAGFDTFDRSSSSLGVQWNMSTGAASYFSQGSTIIFQTMNMEAGSMGSGADSVTGNTVGNLLDGNGGNDTFDGSGGSDTLDGGTGFDSLTGGTGADQFVFIRSELVTGANDTITDYSPGEGDVLVVKGGTLSELALTGTGLSRSFNISAGTNVLTMTQAGNVTVQWYATESATTLANGAVRNYDAAGFGEWAEYTQFYDSQNRFDYESGVYDGGWRAGGSWTTDVDQAGDQYFQYYRNEYNSAGQAYQQFGLTDDGRSWEFVIAANGVTTTQSWGDQNGTRDWSGYIDFYDAFGRLDYEIGTYDSGWRAGGTWSYDQDQNNDSSFVDWYRNEYNVAGQLYQQFGYTDDGRAWELWYDNANINTFQRWNDVANNYSFSYYTDTRGDYGNGLTWHRVGLNDNGSAIDQYY